MNHRAAATIAVVFVGLVCMAWFLGARGLRDQDIASPEEQPGGDEPCPPGGAAPVTPVGPSSPEAYVESLFSGDQTSEENREEIIRTLPHISWKKYEMAVGIGGTLELLQWLYGLRPYTIQHLPFILQATEGLDGAYAELYSEIVGDLFVVYGRDFVRVMSTLTAEQVRQLSGFLAYYSASASHRSPQHMRALYLEHLGAPGITPEEKEVLEQMIRAIDALPD